MALSDFPVRASVAVSDIDRAVTFYEGSLQLPLVRTGPSAAIAEGARVYRSGPETLLNVYESGTAGRSAATVAAWVVDDLDAVVDDLAAAGVDLVRYEQFEHDGRGIAPRAGGGRIGWFQDPDGNTFSVESDT